MAAFIGDHKNTQAVRCGLKINSAVRNIIQPALTRQYRGRFEYVVRQTVGIDTSQLLVAQTGIRGSNDLVWVGRAANYAAKMAALSPAYATRISETVYRKMLATARISSDGRNMWTKLVTTELGIGLFGSNWTWRV